MERERVKSVRKVRRYKFKISNTQKQCLSATYNQMQTFFFIYKLSFKISQVLITRLKAINSRQKERGLMAENVLQGVGKERSAFTKIMKKKKKKSCMVSNGDRRETAEVETVGLGEFRSRPTVRISLRRTCNLLGMLQARIKVSMQPYANRHGFRALLHHACNIHAGKHHRNTNRSL